MLVAEKKNVDFFGDLPNPTQKVTNVFVDGIIIISPCVMQSE